MLPGGSELPEGVELTRLDGGVRVVTEEMPSVRSVAIGLWVRAGSRDEAPDQAGVSHFLEHMLFKGTENRSAIEISEQFDGMGAAVNAATGKESTNLHGRMLDEHTPRAFELMSEMLLGPTYPEVDSEREVVLEEIAMYEDEPSDRVHDVLDEAIFGDHPLGKRVIGSADVIASIPVPEISAYHRSRYTGPNVVVAAAGHLEHARIVELAERHLGSLEGDGGAAPTAPNGAAPRASFYEKDTEQYHVCLGAPGLARADERRFTFTVLDAIFGGATSSRLFREVREKRGLAYAIGSYAEQHIDAGTLACYVGTREDNVAEALEVIGRELAQLHAEGASEEEVERAKEHVKGRVVLSLEASGARMSRCGRAILFGAPLLSLDETLERIDAVSREDVAELAAELYDPARFSAACVGPREERFRAALEPVSGELAGATA